MMKIEFSEVSFTAVGSEGDKFPILHEVSFQIESGKSLTILGPSGSGKSTLLRLSNRMIDPTGGEILFEGKPIQDVLVTQLRRRVGMVFQTPVLLKDLTLRDNLLFGIHQGHPPKHSDDNPLAEQLLSQVGLPLSILDQKPETLSVGQAQRLCLARTLGTNPEVLLLDEPTSSLDPSAKQEIERLISGLLNNRQLTALFVTHDLGQARRLGGEAAVLVEGKLVESGNILDLLENPEHDLTRRFVSGNLSAG